MMTSLIAAAVLGNQPQLVDLSRVFKKGATYTYGVKTHMLTEQRQQGVITYIPSEVDINYDFTYKVDDIKPSGFASVRYKRPFMSIIDGETADAPATETKEKVNYDLQIELSPVNAVVGIKDLTDGKLQTNLLNRRMAAKGLGTTQDIVSQFAGELQRLALFIGSLDSALDFNPKLPFEEVKLGEKWKRTVSYQPQELKGSKGEHAVQRLDMEYSYAGIIEKAGKKYHRINATLALDTDASLFINQAMGMTANQSGLEKLPLKLNSTIEFDLDLNTRDTVYAKALTKGGWSLKVVGEAEERVEEKINGRASITLKSIK